MDKNLTGFAFNGWGGGLNWLENLPDCAEDLSEVNLNEFFEIMKERQLIWYRRNAGMPPPWTTNEILRDYKYTNVYRELDRASQFMIKNILTQDIPLKEKLFKMMVFRFYNQPNSFVQNGGLIELPSYEGWLLNKVPEKLKLWKQTVSQRETRANPWHTAYMMNMAFAPKLDKPWSSRGLHKDWAYTQYCFQGIHDAIPSLMDVLREAEKPEQIIKVLETIPAVSSFQSHEFFIDLTYFARYSPGGAVMRFDANDFTNVGPGASLGLRLIFPSLTPNKQKEGIYLLRDLAVEMLVGFPYLGYNSSTGEYFTGDIGDDGIEPINLHQIEMWLCEFSKYWKMKLGVGKQRSKYCHSDIFDKKA